MMDLFSFFTSTWTIGHLSSSLRESLGADRQTPQNTHTQTHTHTHTHTHKHTHKHTHTDTHTYEAEKNVSPGPPVPNVTPFVLP